MFFTPNVSGDKAVQTTMEALDVLLHAQGADYPMLRINFEKKSIDFLYVEGGNGSGVGYVKMYQCGTIDEQTCYDMIERNMHLSKLPQGFEVSYSYKGSGGECDSQCIKGSIPTQHKNAGKAYRKEIERLCNAKGIKNSASNVSIGFLNWAK